MKSRAARIVLLAAALVVVLVPTASLSEGCADEGDAESCGFDCALCLCCFHVRTVLASADGGLGLRPAANVGAETAAAPAGPFPRDILHVPKPPPSH